MLYRYRSAVHLQRELKAIEDNYVFCSPFASLNDPMEGVFGSTRRARQAENYRSIRRAITDIKAQVGICSFSEVHDHELMWAHYAGHFAGTCVAYRFAQLLETLPSSVSFARMFYSEKVPMVRHRTDSPETAAKMILSYKNHRWLYEREWRMFGPLGRVRYRNPKCVARIYLGSRISAEARALITQRMLPLRIAVHEMNIDKYSLTFEPCS